MIWTGCRHSSYAGLRASSYFGVSTIQRGHGNAAESAATRIAFCRAIQRLAPMWQNRLLHARHHKASCSVIQKTAQ